LGVQPESLKPGQRLSETVEAALEALSALLQSLRPPQSAAGQPVAEVRV